MSLCKGLRAATLQTMACLVAATAIAAEPAQPTRLGISQEQDGAFIIDPINHTAWPRCVEGMRWTGSTCLGTPLLLDRSGAMARAAEHRRLEGVNWRLPTVGELRGLLKSSLHPRGLDPELFPPIASEWVWSVSVMVNTAPVNQYNYANIMKGRNAENTSPTDALTGMAINLVTGQTRSDVPKSTKLPVRLVLPQD